MAKAPNRLRQRRVEKNKQAKAVGTNDSSADDSAASDDDRVEMDDDEPLRRGHIPAGAQPDSSTGDDSASDDDRSEIGDDEGIPLRRGKSPGGAQPAVGQSAQGSCCSWPVVLLSLAIVGGMLVLRFWDGLLLQDLDSTASHKGRMEDVDLYGVLELAHDASPTLIRASYRKAALQWHPDKCSSEACAGLFLQATRAHEVLTDPVRRSVYDQTRSNIEPIESEAVDLTVENFARVVLDTDELWFVQVYAEWAPGAERFASVWETEVLRFKEYARGLDGGGSVRFGRIHVTRQSDLFIRLPIVVRASNLPTVVSYFRARPTPWARWLGRPRFSDWVRDEIPALVREVKAAAFGDFLNSLPDSRTVISLFTTSAQPVSAACACCCVGFVYNFPCPRRASHNLFLTPHHQYAHPLARDADKSIALFYDCSLVFVKTSIGERDLDSVRALLPTPIPQFPAVLVSRTNGTQFTDSRWLSGKLDVKNIAKSVVGIVSANVLQVRLWWHQ